MSVFRNLLMSISESGKKLPDEYQEVEYIQSDGNQYINTGLTSSRALRLDIDFEFVSLNTRYNRLFGATQIGGSQYGIRSSITTGGTFFGELPTQNSDEEITTGVSIQANNRYKIIFNDNFKFYIDDNLEGSFPEYNHTGTQQIYVMRQNSPYASASYGVAIKLYSCQLYNNGVLARDYVPCYRKNDSVIGLYDLVNNTFYTNAGTGTFTKGADVMPYTEVNYLQGNSYNVNQNYFDTGYVPNSNTKIEVKYMFTTNVPHDYDRILGCNAFKMEIYTAKYLYVRIGTSGGWTYANYGSLTANTEYILNVDNSKIYLNNSLVKQVNPITINTDRSIYLFSENIEGNDRNSRGRIYYCKIWENDILVRDIIPVLDKNNVPCMYDKITNTFYYNLGEGSFSWG